MLAFLLPALLALSAPALPCVALVHEPGELAESDGQETIFWRDAASGDAVVEYLVRYEGTAADFGWIIAIPGAFTQMSDGDEAHFEALREATSPAVWYMSTAPYESGGCCLSNAKSDGGGERGNSLGDSGALLQDGVDIVAEGFTGTYSYTAVAADDATALQAWLDTNGWDVGDTADAIDAYVADGFGFVLVELLPSVGETPDEGRTLPPVVIQYGGGDMVFPARMAVGFGSQVFQSTVWVLGEHAATVSGWTSTQESWLEGSDDPDVVWEEALWAAGGDSPGYLLSHARKFTFHEDFDLGWVTRFDALAAGSAHTVDATFELDGEDVDVSTTIEVWGASDTGCGADPAAVGLLGLGVLIRRRE